MNKEDIMYITYEKSWTNQGRRFCYVNKNIIPFYQFVWNLYNSENKIRKGDGYVIHHKDRNRLNDHLYNLEKMLNKEHSSIHSKGNKNCLGMIVSRDTKRKISETTLGQKKTKEHGDNISKGKKGMISPFYGKKHSEESKNKIRLSKEGKKFPNLSESKRKWWRDKKYKQLEELIYCQF